MKQFVSKVTVTGADDSVRPEDLVEIAKEFPFAEFGILLSRNASGCTRFPSAGWLADMVDTCRGKGMSFAGHMCGGWVREILKGEWPTEELAKIHKDFMAPDMFQRWQINTHAVPHDMYGRKLSQLLKMLSDNQQQVIFQYDNVNTQIVTHAQEKGHGNISALFDLSHGAGILPGSWPKPIDNLSCGYAGGLSPENVAGQLSQLESVVGLNIVWIDAETWLRTDSKVFDLEKVCKFLQEAQPWVVSR